MRKYIANDLKKIFATVHLYPGFNISETNRR
jgi:hypothetical protein